ncbi:MAG TPA: cytochrome c biogenesis protein CcdA [Solirubrobacteraceae bacterium]|nr:cytochrome c biogenesis protein CcdA [Solirubrobacteraceae bacterium]
MAVADPASGVGVLAAVAAGTVSFLSPCVLPLVPGYLSTVVGVSPDELDRTGLRRVLLPSLLFIASFSTIFILLGLSATAIGSLLTENKVALQRIAAAIIVALGILYIASAFLPRLGREWHPERLLRRAGKGGPLLAGAAFAIAWTPCVGPTLGAILTAASYTASEGRAALLLAFYSAGLAIPFLATALAFNRMASVFSAVKRHYGAVVVLGGTILIAMGVLIWTGELTVLNQEAQNGLSSLGIDFFNI